MVLAIQCVTTDEANDESTFLGELEHRSNRRVSADVRDGLSLRNVQTGEQKNERRRSDSQPPFAQIGHSRFDAFSQSQFSQILCWRHDLVALDIKPKHMPKTIKDVLKGASICV